MCVRARGGPGCGRPGAGGGAGSLQVRGRRSQAAEMDFDAYQHYFYDCDYEEDFYRSTAPSEDIWKKFELVPSPPMSPPWGCGPGACCSSAAGGPPEPWPGGCAADEAEARGPPKAPARNYASIIRSDCMWSGFSARERLEKAMSDKLAPKGAAAKPAAAAEPACGHPGPEALEPPAACPCAPGEPKPPACSGSESQSDSEGEEIDVVTVERRQSLSVRKPVTITVRADPLDPCMKHFHISIHQQQHNYAARFPPENCPQEGTPEKEAKEEEGEEEEEEEEEEEQEEVEELVGPPGPASPPSSEMGPSQARPASSDTEDVTKRKNHNFLERKRRNDLRSRFLALRDQVPALGSCTKTPKVVILSKALEYLQTLVNAEKTMALEKRHLRARQQQLQKRLAQLTGH
ncbi:LOW QUALITY PROTEIN: protein L-Myc [Macrotis lagotis]|uniref:LOW QUALITY PROTEIN: protein L-Myc n=1 Tax=Macrotis lagotis TaxID=92651 RepID=UPI003D69C251